MERDIPRDDCGKKMSDKQTLRWLVDEARVHRTLLGRINNNLLELIKVVGTGGGSGQIPNLTPLISKTEAIAAKLQSQADAMTNLGTDPK